MAAILLVPVIGTLSDKVNTPVGRRTPFLIIFTLISCMAMLAIPIVVPLGQAIVSSSNDLAITLVISFLDFINLLCYNILLDHYFL